RVDDENGEDGESRYRRAHHEIDRIADLDERRRQQDDRDGQESRRAEPARLQERERRKERRDFEKLENRVTQRLDRIEAIPDGAAAGAEIKQRRDAERDGDRADREIGS